MSRPYRPKPPKKREAVFTVTVEYDPDVTDPDSLGNALDILMTTALSTPEILDEYGNPSIGEFLLGGLTDKEE